jgi:hypothetical protein
MIDAMRITLLVILAVLGAPAIALACEETGKPIYKETRAVIAEPTGAHEEIVVFGNGAWHTASGDGARDGPGDAGCLTRKRLAEVKRALKKARFAQGTPNMCDAVSTTSITYQAPNRRRRVATEIPCGRTVDRSTERAIACVTAAIDASVTLGQLRAVCRKR